MSESPPIVGATILRWADGVLRRSAGDETVLLDMVSEEFYGLEGVGARVFELFEQPQTLDAVIDTVLAEYDVERDVLTADLQELVADLLSRNLLVTDA